MSNIFVLLASGFVLSSSFHAKHAMIPLRSQRIDNQISPFVSFVQNLVTFVVKETASCNHEDGKTRNLNKDRQHDF